VRGIAIIKYATEAVTKIKPEKFRLEQD